MNLLIKLRDWIAKGNNPYFVAFNAHCWSAAIIVLLLSHFCGHALLWFSAIIMYAAIKEFWFDATYEVPKQSAFDNETDFLGYCIGALIGAELFLRVFH